MSKSQFDSFYTQALEKACDIKRQRGEQYNRTNSIREYWVYGLQSIYSEIWGKALRLRSLLGIHVGWIHPDESDGHTFDDSCMDLINYAAFLYAENRCRFNDHENRRIHESAREQTIRDTINLDFPSSDSDVERMVLDEKPESSDHQFSTLHVGACPSCTDVFDRARTDPGDGEHGVGNSEHPESPSGPNDQNPEGSVLLRDDEGN